MVDRKPLQKEELYEFSVFRLDAGNGALYARGEAVRLAPKVLACLVALVGARGAVVSREELLAAVWPDGDGNDAALAYTISQLRKSLAEHDPATEAIETFPKRGYRFRGGLESANPLAVADGGFMTEIVERRRVEEIWIEEYDDAVPALAGRSAFSGRRIVVAAAVLIAVVAAIGFGAYKFGVATGRTGTPPVKSVAVLPFRSFTAADGDGSLRLRMMDALISRLGGIESLTVRPTSATSRFLDSEEDPVAIGRRLEVDAVLEGRLQREGGRLRVTLQLIGTETGRQIWSDQFDGAEDRSLDLQDAVAARLAGFLGAGRGRDARQATRDPRAYEEYLTGRFHWQRRTEDGLRRAIAAFERAIEIDPGFADAFAGLADAQYMLVDYAYDVSPRNIDDARRNVDRALELNPLLAEAYVVRARIEASRNWNWDAAETAARRAIALDPNNAAAHLRLGMSMMPSRRLAEAEAAIRRARELDPTSPTINMNLGFALFGQKRLAEARAQFDRAIDLDRNFSGPLWFKARVLRIQGETEKVHSTIADALEAEGNAETASKVRAAGNDDAAVLDILDATWRASLANDPGEMHSLAMISLWRRDDEAALEWLEKSVAARHPWAPAANVLPEFDGLRESPRFQALLAKMNLR